MKFHVPDATNGILLKNDNRVDLMRTKTIIKNHLTSYSFTYIILIGIIIVIVINTYFPIGDDLIKFSITGGFITILLQNFFKLNVQKEIDRSKALLTSKLQIKLEIGLKRLYAYEAILDKLVDLNENMNNYLAPVKNSSVDNQALFRSAVASYMPFYNTCQKHKYLLNNVLNQSIEEIYETANNIIKLCNHFNINKEATSNDNEGRNELKELVKKFNNLTPLLINQLQKHIMELERI